MLERETRPATERMAHDEPTLADLVRAEGLTLPVLGDALTQPQDVELTVIDYLKPTLSWPFGLAVAGTVLGLVVAVINAR